MSQLFNDDMWQTQVLMYCVIHGLVCPSDKTGRGQGKQHTKLGWAHTSQTPN